MFKSYPRCGVSCYFGVLVLSPIKVCVCYSCLGRMSARIGEGNRVREVLLLFRLFVYYCEIHDCKFVSLGM